MDFMAGAMFGIGLSGLFVMLMWSGTITTADDMVKTLKQILEENRSQEKYDDADNWKLGRTEDDDG